MLLDLGFHMAMPYIQVPAFRNYNLKIEDSQKRIYNWEIGVPYDNSLYYCCVLARLVPVAKRRNKFLNKIISRKLLRCRKVYNIDDIIQCVRSYNPFEDRHSCFINANFQAFIRDLKKSVYEFVDKNPEKFKIFSNVCATKEVAFDELPTDYVLQAFSLMLDCSIIVLKNITGENTDFKEIIYSIGEANYRRTKIILYQKQDGGNFQVSFGLSQKFSKRLQRAVLRRILLKSETMKSQVDIFYCLLNDNKNLIITLLKMGSDKIIKELFLNKNNLLLKLSDAGFAVNPTMPDVINIGYNYPTAFYYSIEKGYIDIIYILYSYSTGYFVPCEFSPRSPKSVPLSNLNRLSVVLSETKELLIHENDHDPKIIDDLILFHKFLIHIVEHVQKAHNENFHEKTFNELLEVEKRKKIISVIINAYFKHFYIDNEDNDNAEQVNEGNVVEQYHSFIKHIDYYMNVDYFFIVTFFDYLFALKEMLKLEINCYDAIESCLIRYIFAIKYYNYNENYFIFSPKDTSKVLCVPWFIPCSDKVTPKVMLLMTFFERVNLRKAIREFLQKISSTIVSYENKRDKLPKSEVYTLEKEPEIKDEFLLQRLKFYKDVICSIEMEKDDMEVYAACIERALQVIGELLKLNVWEDLTPSKVLLMSALPYKIVKNWAQLRNLLSHHSAKEIHARTEAKNDKTLFQGLKDDLIRVYEIVIFIIRIIHIDRMHTYILSSGLKIVLSNKDFLNGDMTIGDAMLLLGMHADGDFKLEEESCVTRDDIFEATYRVLSHILTSCIDRSKESLEDSVYSFGCFETCFKNIKSRIEWQLKTKDLKCFEVETKDNIHSLFQSIEVLLKFLIEIYQHKKGDHQHFSNLFTPEDFKISSTSNVKQEVEHKLQKLQDIIHIVLRDMGLISLPCFMLTPLDFVECERIQKFKQMLDGKPFLLAEFKTTLLAKVPQKYRNHHQAKLDILNALTQPSSDQDINIMINQLLPRYRNLARKAYNSHDVERLNNISDTYQKFEDGLRKEKLNKIFFDEICQNFGFNNDIKTKLGTIVKGQQKLPHCSVLQFFCNRVQILKRILVDSDVDIRNLWLTNTLEGKETENLMKTKMVQLFLKVPKICAAVELLFCDCATLLKDRKVRWESLWNKANNMFNGIDVRNVLAHGNPLLEATDIMLDPNDLANEIISKTMLLINDLDAIEAMTELQRKTHADFEKFRLILDKKENKESEDLCDTIKKCSRWVDYMYLIPRKSQTVTK